MSTGIEWTDETWNCVTGCTKVSAGCDHCYAERITNRFGGPGAFDKVILHPERLDKPLHWRKPRRVFVNSMSDLFHDDVPNDLIVEVFATMALAHQHTFQILTKRHARMASLLNDPHFDSELVHAVQRRWEDDKRVDHRGCSVLGQELWDAGVFARESDWNDLNLVVPLRNVWLGVSVENQQWADIRIPALRETPAAVRFLSCEPLLGPIELREQWLGGPIRRMTGTGWDPRIDWCIVGGESGPGARPMHPDWARSLRDQCQAAGVPYFFKQRGEFTWDDPGDGRQPDGMLLTDGRLVGANEQVWFVDTIGAAPVARVGKKRAGRELDGRTWDEFPTEARA